jgi:selT/selW/selH-like putative selenoprotein
VARLLQTFGPLLASVEVVAGTGGVFDVDLDGVRVFEKKMLGRYPEPEDVVPLILAAIRQPG